MGSWVSIFAFDVRSFLLVLAFGNVVLGVLIGAFAYTNAETTQRQSLRWFAMAKVVQAVAWMMLLLRGLVPNILSVHLGNTSLLAGLAVETWAMMSILRFASKRAEFVHFALSGAGIVLFNCVALMWSSPRGWVASASLGVTLCLLGPSLLLLTASRESPFKRGLGVGNLILVVVLLARAVYALVDDKATLFATGFVQGLSFIISILIMLVNSTVYLLLSKEDADRVLRELATTDALTGLSNRRSFMAQAGRVWAYHRRYHLPLSVLFLDIDHFKAINDTYGHAMGDRVIRHLSQVIRSSVREFDLHCRFGGEEFVVLLYNAPRATSTAVAERLRTEIARQTEQADGARLVSYTVSIGIGCSREGEDDSLPNILVRSDEALYAAKRAGRDRIMTDDGPGGADVAASLQRLWVG